jgi:hypothetical protein
MKNLKNYTKAELLKDILNKELEVEEVAIEFGLWKSGNGKWYLADEF